MEFILLARISQDARLQSHLTMRSKFLKCEWLTKAYFTINPGGTLFQQSFNPTLNYQVEN